MKKILAYILLGSALFISAPIFGADKVPIFRCYASSKHNKGYGWSSNPAEACSIAMKECYANTPYWDVCVVRWCAKEP